MSNKLPVSAVILTLDEEKNIVSCINALREWCGEVVVFDSFSSDRTCELAEQAGAKVVKRRFDNYAAQRNAALECGLIHEWVLMADADEIWDSSLGEKIGGLLADEAYKETALFHFQRKDMFMGRYLKHSLNAETWFGRLMKRSCVRVEREINEEYHTDGKKSYIRDCRFVHYPFSKGLSWWIARHNRYSDMEAGKLAQEKCEEWHWAHLFARDPVLRRKAVKQFAYRLPCRPLVGFFYLYFVKLGILDGAAGFHYALLRSVYEYFIALKTRENQLKKDGKGF